MKLIPRRTQQPFAFVCLWLIVACLFSTAAQAKLNIEITQGVARATPIAVVPFAWNVPDEVEPVNTVSLVVSSDLYRSGLFDPMPERDMIEKPTDPGDVRYGTWRLLKV
ncbi:MAG: hypothetical protein MI750_17185, partial [Xanthomonadales bacterium]|nr:hypothetical protein [Xanthomonadales bacterium]